MEKLNIAVSACLLGSEVRYDGTGKLQSIMLEELKPIANWVGLCPEVEAGLGIPREPIELVQSANEIRVLQVSNSEIDRTDALRDCVARQTWLAQLDGFIFKARSPSCGVATTPLWNTEGKKINETDGEFVRGVRTRFPNLPLIDEEQWLCPTRRALFLDSAQAYRISRVEN